MKKYGLAVFAVVALGVGALALDDDARFINNGSDAINIMCRGQNTSESDYSVNTALKIACSDGTFLLSPKVGTTASGKIPCLKSDGTLGICDDNWSTVSSKAGSVCDLCK